MDRSKSLVVLVKKHMAPTVNALSGELDRSWNLQFVLSLPVRLARWLWRTAAASVRWLMDIAKGLWGWIGLMLNCPVKSLLKGLAVVVAVVLVLGWLGLLYMAYKPSTQVARIQPEVKHYYLDQGWGSNLSSADRQTYYYTPQGTSLLATGFRYSWLIHLESPESKEPFIKPDHMRALGFQVDDVPTKMNPDLLPVGFTRHFAPECNEEVLDITCAACHTGELHAVIKGESAGIRIDGGQAMHAFTSTAAGQFGPTLASAMAMTAFLPFTKFDRFAKGVLGNHYPQGKWTLYSDFVGVLWSLARQSFDDGIHNRYPVEEGFGRTDAIGRIANRAFGTDLDPANFAPGNAPVSFPAIWDAHYWDWVQYTASVAQPMARNVGETLGVGATLGLMDHYGLPLPPKERFVNQTLIENLKTIEDTIAKLEPPRWPEELLGPVDTEKAAKGKVLFEKHCAHCHEPCYLPDSDVYVQRPLLLEEKDPAKRKHLWHIQTIPVDEIGTDPLAAMNFVNRKINLEKTGLTREEVVAKVRPILEEKQKRIADWAKQHGQKPPDPDEAQCAIQQELDAVDVKGTTIGQALNYMGIFIQDKYYKQLGISTGHVREEDAIRDVMEHNGDGALDTPQVLMAYKPRPLGGAWATAPYLHNGSVPTLYDLLSPANERPRKFFIRSRMDFDPVRVGLVSSPAGDKGFWFDTTIPGNYNGGHEFRAGYAEWTPCSPPAQGVIGPELKPEERWQIIEYLKKYRENPPLCKSYEEEAKDYGSKCPPVPKPKACKK